LNDVAVLNVEIDITGMISASVTNIISASIFVPSDTATRLRSPVVLVCAPGGGYGRSYFDIHVPGSHDYSFASYMSARGFIVVSSDHFGTGESTKPSDGDVVRTKLMAAAAAAMVLQIKERIARGSLADCIPPLPDAHFVGLGHSMGGCVSIIQQGEFGSYDALCILGFPNGHKGSAGGQYKESTSEDLASAIETGKKLFLDSWNDVYSVIDRGPLHHWHHWQDVPPDVIAVDETLAIAWPRMSIVDAFISGLTSPYAKNVRVPVFLGFGESDLTRSTHSEPAYYENSRDVTLFVLSASGHCHNFARNRHLLWARIDAWISDVLLKRSLS
jgi:pimeloyl-ACP methyl ester carboxylesterase